MYPPRPKRTVPPNKVSDYEKLGYVGQLKFNGTRLMIEFRPNGEIKLWTRHLEAPKQFDMPETMLASLKIVHDILGSDQWHVLDGELLHSKTKGIKETIVFFDVLASENELCVGTTMTERQNFLLSIFTDSEEPDNDPSYENVTGKKIAFDLGFDSHNHLWLAETFFFNLEGAYNRAIELDEVEGLVLKKPNAKLKHGHSENNNGNWQIRCRKPHKNYSF
jgi:ATP-dependent DNA ligase